MLYKSVEDQFISYVDSFLSGDEEKDYHLLIKKEHSIRVKDIAAEICVSEKFDEDEVIIGTITALLHDIGRFEQFSKYQTFVDKKSVDHGNLGAEIIEELDILDQLDKATQSAIKHAVFYHNKLTFPDHARLEDLLTKLVRDADKLDIFKVITAHLGSTEMRDKLILHLPDTEEYSREIIADIYEGKLVDYAKRKTFNDMKLTMLNWIQEMNFRYSYQHVLEKDYINIFCDSLPDTEEISKIRTFFLSLTEENFKKSSPL